MNNMIKSSPMYMPGIADMKMLRLATAYFVIQQLNTLYPPEKGLEKGTIFPELYMPYGMNPEFTVDM